LQLNFGVCKSDGKNKKQKTKTNIQALILFSGGLDSMLAAKILQKQGINITLICFTSYFFQQAGRKICRPA